MRSGVRERAKKNSFLVLTFISLACRYRKEFFVPLHHNNFIVVAVTANDEHDCIGNYLPTTL